MIVQIPGNASLWECNINGRKYAYPGGTTQNVPDEVGLFIRSIQDFPPEAEDVQRPFEGEPFPELPGAATKTKAGLVKMAAAVDDAKGEAPTAAEYNALLASLRNAGIMASS